MGWVLEYIKEKSFSRSSNIRAEIGDQSQPPRIEQLFFRFINSIELRAQELTLGYFLELFLYKKIAMSGGVKSNKDK
jgi:hypothetical protein